MAIASFTIGSNQGGQAASTPLRAIPVSFPGDAAYATGGTADFEGSIQAELGEEVTVLGVLGQDCDGYVVQYDRANDKLLVYEAGADGAALDEIGAGADLHATTFNVLVFCN